jgi:hypothetical protein
MKHPLITFLAAWLIASAALFAQTPAPPQAEVKSPAISGTIADGKLRLIIEGPLGTAIGEKERLIFATSLHHWIKAHRDKLHQHIDATFTILEGAPKELPLTIAGEGEIKQITGEALLDWSIRQDPGGTRTLILRTKKSDKPLTQFAATIIVERELRAWKNPIATFTITPPQPELFSGFVRVESVPEFDVQAEFPGSAAAPAGGESKSGAGGAPAAGAPVPLGLFPIELKYLPEPMRAEPKPDEPDPLAFQFHGSAVSLPLKITAADPELRQVVLRDFKLTGQLANDTAAFTLNATARVTNPRGGSIAFLSGGIALTELPAHPEWRIHTNDGRFVLTFDKPGDYPLTFKFNAIVKQGDGWSTIDFRVAPSALAPIALSGLAADTQFQFVGAARPERKAEEFASFLPPDGSVKLAWKSAAPETEGKLFYAAEMLAQISIAPGLMRQVALIDGRVMQGEMSRVTLLLRGAGEVTRVSGDAVLSWRVEPGANASERRLLVEFNQPQKNQFALQVQTQTPLGAFPQTAEAVQLRPEGATRFAGFFRILNEGAVRLEIAEARGLSQVSPEQFPESDATKGAFREGGGQRFAFRFSGVDSALKIQADQILPEVGVSEVLAYHHGENELTIDAEIELDIREAPLRELLLRVPKGYAVARLNVANLSDYFLRDAEDDSAELRFVFSEPVLGRQVLQLRLERNAALGAEQWPLPRVEVMKAKSVRGQIAVSADAGFRATPERTQSLTEIATAFFPRKVPNIQSAFRLSDPAWQATMRIERLPQSIQADAFHLFSVGEGVAYGSSVLNYVVSGAPIGAFKVELSAEYFNVEFTGKEVRNWQKIDGGFVVQLHTPVSGAYTLLATYERPFKAQGETLAFTGARPLDAKTEQGHTLVISAYQFQVKPVTVSTGLLPLEPGEVPAEYRLFFDAPILAAYRYSARPFDLKLALSPLAQGDSVSQVVDRAAFETRISKEGQVLTDAHYFVKSRGHSHFRLTLPEGAQLWSATVNRSTVVPVKDGSANLIPLPQQADPNTVLEIDLKIAADRAKNPKRVRIAAPIVDAPVMLADWKVAPDVEQRLLFREGSLAPLSGVADVSGFAMLARAFSGGDAGEAWMRVAATIALLALAAGVWRGGAREGGRPVAALVIGCVAFVLASVAFVSLADLAARHAAQAPRDIAFLAPVQQAGGALWVEVANVEDKPSVLSWIGALWPAVLALVALAWAWLAEKPVWRVAGWTLLAWATLRAPNGAGAFFILLAIFFLLHLAIPALRRLLQVRRSRVAEPGPAAGGAAATTAAIVLFALLASSASAQTTPPQSQPISETVTQQIRVEEKFALATATIRWQAAKGERLPVLFEPAVMTRISHPPQLKLVQAAAGNRRAQQLLALEAGAFDIEVAYQIAVTRKEAESGITLPAQFGMVNRVTLTIAGLDVDVVSPQAVSIERKPNGKDTQAALVLAPANDAWIAWKPRSRDVSREKAVFYTELAQLYVPTAGVIEGVHSAAIRPAQGELGELTFTVPKGATITDVHDPVTTVPVAENQKPPPSIVSQWRFDPDTAKLRVTLTPAQSRPFALVIRSQIATGPLPITQSVGLISVENAANQIGTLGVATGSDVQLDTVDAAALSALNLEDFPALPASLLAAQIPGLTVRRAFRYDDAKATSNIKASAVEPDIRVESQDTLSLGEDRVLLAVNAKVEIARSGIFRLSFALPAGMDVESVAGKALSHWSESKADDARIITLLLRGRTDGVQEFTISLSGPGVKTAKAWPAPQIAFREASKQRGTYLVSPEQGMRLQVAAREGATQLDPRKSGITQKGVLAFRVLQTPWSLALDLEQVDAWVQVTSLQHAIVGEAQVKMAANLQLQIENTGLKSFRVQVPDNAENVRFHGEQVADFLAVPNAGNAGLQTWEVKLHRRVIGQYLLQLTYQTAVPPNAAETSLRGVQVADVNLQRGFVTVQSGGRLQVRIEAPPAALQVAEWQSIPRALQRDLDASSASFAYRLVEPAFTLPLKLDRHEAAKLLPARVNSVLFSSVVSDNGAMLTQARLDMLPGDKRLLHLTLPKGARFWFAFVNRKGVWPWREGDQLLIPLEPQERGGQAIPVEIFFSSEIGGASTRSFDLELLAPKFDLPLENITWRVFLDEKWHVTDVSGSLQKQSEEIVPRAQAVDVQRYLETEATQLREKTKAAERMLAAGNKALEKGNSQEARRAFESAFGLSQHDQAFNEDARVQLHNLKLQQAVVGLNVRNSVVAGDTSAVNKLRVDAAGKEANYTQQDAKQLIERNPADENAALAKCAERIIQQQDAAVTNPAVIQASIPEQGRLITFHRAIAVDPLADLKVGIEANAPRAATWALRLMILAATALTIALGLRMRRA